MVPPRAVSPSETAFPRADGTHALRQEQIVALGNQPGRQGADAARANRRAVRRSQLRRGLWDYRGPFRLGRQVHQISVRWRRQFFNICAWIVNDPGATARSERSGLSYAAHTQMALACYSERAGLSAMVLNSGGFADAYREGIRRRRSSNRSRRPRRMDRPRKAGSESQYRCCARGAQSGEHQILVKGDALERGPLAGARIRIRSLSAGAVARRHVQRILEEGRHLCRGFLRPIPKFPIALMSSS